VSDLGPVVEREMDRVRYAPFTLETFLLERDRRLARQRLAAALVAVGVLVVLVLVGLGIARAHDNSVLTPGGAAVHGAGPLTFATSYGVYMQSSDGHRVRLTGAAVSAFAWSPDGSKLAYLGGRGGPDCVLWVEDVASGAQTRLADCSQNDRGGGVAWSPDGSRLLYVGEHALTTIGADGSSPQTVGTFPRSGLYDLSWSPDGTRISFAQGGNLYVTTVDAWHPVPVAEGVDFAWAPDWSQLAYVRDDATERSTADPFILQAFVAQPDGSDPRLVAEQRGCCIGAMPGVSWSPDGRMISLLGLRIQLVDVATGHERVITDKDLIFGVPPAWRPVPEN
jgi:Tol biopolymer transport system component